LKVIEKFTSNRIEQHTKALQLYENKIKDQQFIMMKDNIEYGKTKREESENFN
jgi:hypothetical protein